MSAESPERDLSARHVRIGWWAVFVFIVLGAVLEGLHAFKASLYVDLANESRRLMWTLAHAHGTLLGLLHFAFAVTVRWLPDWSPGPRTTASRALTAATVLLPGGFFLGGLIIHGGDPGIGIALVPVGAVLLAIAAFCAARAR